MQMHGYRRPDRPPDMEAQITLVGTEGGGRRGEVCSGYRPDHDFGIGGTLWCASHEYPEVELLHPGETTRAFLWVARPTELGPHLYNGLAFTIHEGAQLVGRGKVVSILNEALRRGV